MKKIRILALLVIVVFVAEVIMSNGTADFRRGWTVQVIVGNLNSQP